jgi:hypothetical protein
MPKFNEIKTPTKKFLDPTRKMTSKKLLKKTLKKKKIEDDLK